MSDLTARWNELANDLLQLHGTARGRMMSADAVTLNGKVFAFHSTKGGSYRGVTTFEHDVDMVVEFTGFAQMVQRGRFQAYGEMKLSA